MSSERTPTTVRLSEDEKSYIVKHCGSIQAMVDKALEREKEAWTVWEPRIPSRLIPAYSILRELALVSEHRKISLWDAISNLCIELDISEKGARSHLNLLHRWKVIFRRYGLAHPQGYVIVATSQEEFDILNNGHQVTKSETKRSADEGPKEEGTDTRGNDSRKGDRREETVCIASG